MNKVCRNFVALLVMLALIPLAVLVELFEGDRCPTMEWIDDVAARWDEWANKE